MAKSVRFSNGYRLIYKPVAESSMTKGNWKGYVYEHIYVAEKMMGRKLTSKEVVHHLDGNRINNRTDNLLVLERSMHAKLHSWLKGAILSESQDSNGVNSKKSKAKEPLYCLICDSILQRDNKKYCCAECAAKAHRKVDRPSKDQLRTYMSSMSWIAIGKKYSVSDNAVRKWAKAYNLL